MNLPPFYVDEIIRTAIKEDINYIDVATDLLIDENQRTKGVMLAKAEGVLCGIDVAIRVFELLGPGLFEFKKFKNDGDRVKCGEIIAEIKGPTTLMLKGERTALNMVQHMSGVATETAHCVSLIEGTKATVADTRKTLPGIRSLQKYAVMRGGGKNHRFNLSDCAMLKDNHIDAAGGIIPAVTALREKIGHTVKIEVETRNLYEVSQAIEAKADIIMLDNMDVATMTEAVNMINGRALTEASGGITYETIGDIAKTGVDIISIGALTHSVKAFDISLKIKVGGEN